ncbi:LamG-like jellyroll fold domain-containing protein [Tolypothrix bouteillei VB521301_2]|uniref:LamG domain-containing protein n=1 Tax=Tolypothrix bouteillei TaxID=1246981 RepID=UPI0038B5802D
MTNKIYTQSVLTFDGQNDYIDFGRNDLGGVFAEGSTAFTIAGWLNPHQLTNKATTYKVHNVFLARSSDRYSDNFEFGISKTGNLDVYIDEKLDNTIKTLGNGELTIGQWHFFAIVFHQGQLTVYLDGHKYTDSLRGPSLNKATSSLTLGATLHNNIYFKGQIANISVWNYACSQDEIQRQRNELLVGNEQGLVAYWRLDDGSGATVRDHTANAHNGKLRGNPKWNLAEIPILGEAPIQDPLAQLSQEEEIQNETATIVGENSPLTAESVLEENSPLTAESVLEENSPLTAGSGVGENASLTTESVLEENAPLTAEIVVGENAPLTTESVPEENTPLTAGSGVGENSPLTAEIVVEENTPLTAKSVVQEESSSTEEVTDSLLQQKLGVKIDRKQKKKQRKNRLASAHLQPLNPKRKKSKPRNKIQNYHYP